jgi:UPF0755 protein
MKRNLLTLVLVLLVIILVGLLLLGIIVTPLGIPGAATDIFGNPGDNLNQVQKIYLSSLLLWQKEDLTTPIKMIGDDVPFQIAQGESAFSVSNRLKDLALIRDVDAFRNYLVYKGIDTQIKTGSYIFNPTMTPVEIARELQIYSSTHVDYAILPGWRVEELAANITYSGFDFSPDQLVDYVHQNGLEGYLLPGTFTLSRDITPEEMASTFVNAFDSNLSAELFAGFEQQGFTLHQAVTLASIVERETVVGDEMPLIASVFINRLVGGIRLNADPTVQYALGFNHAQNTWWTNPLSASDLEIDSPYNTYLYPGLPPGPICNPGMSALRAVAFPAQTPYYYFRAACDNSGRHEFAETYEEHISNACP